VQPAHKGVRLGPGRALRLASRILTGHANGMSEVAFVYREECLAHDTGYGHPESPRRLGAILQAMKDGGLNPPWLDSGEAGMDDLLRAHPQSHIDAVRAACAGDGSRLDPDTVAGPGTWEAALLAAGGALAGARALAKEERTAVFAAMRPPGHHAERTRAMGFCFFNNIAVAARWLQAEGGLKKIAIFDWDVHHGNGTQDIFYEDATVFYASIHQHPLYPGTGYPHERGKNNTNLNIQAGPGIGPDFWLEALEKKVLPQLADFQPEAVLLSAGFDAHRLDPLAGQRLDAEHFGEMTRMVLETLPLPVLSLLEGGYHLDALGASVVAHLQALSPEA